MIICNLHADNFMRYERLELNDLPANGLIAILGQNESGKSTIGECIAFALFGRSIRTARTGGDLTDIIHWKQQSCRVLLDFEADNGDRYQIERQLDRAGTRQAELRRLPDLEPVAKGISEVEAWLRPVVGFSFDEFRYTFYLAQNELALLRRDATDDRQRVIFNMLGITEVEQALGRAQAALTEMTDQRERARTDLSVTGRIAESFDRDKELLSKTEATIGELGQQALSRAETLSSVEQSVDTARQARQARQKAIGLFADLRDRILYRYHADRLALDRTELHAVRQAAELARNGLKNDYIAKSHQRDDLQARLEEAAAMERKLEQLTEGVSLHGAAVRDGLARSDQNPEKRMDYLLSESEREKLSIIEIRIRRRNRRLKRRRTKAAAAVFAGFVLILASGTLTLLIGARNFRFIDEPNPDNSRIVAWTIGAIGVGLLGLAAWTFRRVTLGRRRLATLKETRQTLWSKVDRLKRSMQATERFDPADPAAMLAAMDDIRDEPTQRLFRTIQQEHPAFFRDGRREAAEPLAEQLEQANDALDEIKDRAVLYKHLMNRIDARQPTLDAALQAAGVTATSETPPPAKIGSPEQTEEQVTERLEQAAVSISQIRAAANARPDDRSADAAQVDELVAAVRQLDGVAANGRSDALHHYAEQSRLARLLTDARPTEAAQLDQALEAESALLLSALPPEGELTHLEEECSERMTDERSALAATEARQQALTESVETFTPRFEQGRTLEGHQAEMTADLDRLEEDLAIQTTLVDLLEGTATAMKHRFGPAVAVQIEAILPKITRGRYSQVEVSENLEIRVHSPEKEGLDDPFIHIADLSGGAADQLLVALRLALSGAMLRAKGKPAGTGQFLFFDEPVSSFDSERATQFLDLLANFHDTFCQIFIVSHNEEIARTADRWASAVIHTNLSTGSLAAS